MFDDFGLKVKWNLFNGRNCFYINNEGGRGYFEIKVYIMFKMLLLFIVLRICILFYYNIYF